MKYAVNMNVPTVAVVGGGQLARMLQESANALGLNLRVLVESSEASAAQVVPDAPVGSPRNESDVVSLIRGADVLTFEHEHQDDQILKHLEAEIPVRPSPEALLFARDKIQMRKRLSEIGIPCPRWQAVRSIPEVKDFGDRVGWPIIIKTSRGGYDGKGVGMIDSADESKTWFERGYEILVEEKIDFYCEIAALIARRPGGETRCWPVVTTIQEHGICSEVLYPSLISHELQQQAQEYARKIASQLQVTGVMAVEMFVAKSGEGETIFVNELAMRPHNSGHWTIEGCVTSQFEQHLRAVLDLPLGDTNALAPAVVMVNLLGNGDQDPRVNYPQVMVQHPVAKIHYYGKDPRPGRKLGHVTVLGDNLEAVRQEALSAVDILREKHD